MWVSMTSLFLGKDLLIISLRDGDTPHVIAILCQIAHLSLLSQALSL
jgi:hypothetical protein